MIFIRSHFWDLISIRWEMCYELISYPGWRLNQCEGGTCHVGIISQRQPVLEKHLRLVASRHECSQLRSSCCVIHIEEDKDWVYCNYTDATKGQRRIRAKFLVGADGKRGFTRKEYLEPKGVFMEQISQCVYLLSFHDVRLTKRQIWLQRDLGRSQLEAHLPNCRKSSGTSFLEPRLYTQASLWPLFPSWFQIYLLRRASSSMWAIWKWRREPLEVWVSREARWRRNGNGKRNKSYGDHPTLFNACWIKVRVSNCQPWCVAEHSLTKQDCLMPRYNIPSIVSKFFVRDRLNFLHEVATSGQ